MSIETRATVKALLDLYIKTNGNKEITAVQLNEVITDAIDSAFFQLDELRTALSTSYSPDDANDWLPDVAPTEVKGGLDILAARTGTNLSQNVAYVSNVTTAGIAPERGNPLKPYSSFAAALTALPSDNIIVIALGGTYTEDILIDNKNNTSLILEGITLNGRVILGSNAVDVNISLRGSTITNPNATFALQLNANAGKVSVTGGTVISTNASANGLTGSNSAAIKFLYGVTFVTISSNTFACDNFVFNNCNFFSGTIGIRRTNSSEFYGCTVRTTASNAVRPYTEPCLFYNCTLIGGGFALQGENAVIGYFYYCRIEGLAGPALYSGSASNELFFKGCDLIGSTDCVEYLVNLVRSATTNNQFQDCKLFAGSGVIFNEPTYNVSDLGNTQVINCTYNKTFTPAVGPQKIFEYNKVEIVGLQQPLK